MVPFGSASVPCRILMLFSAASHMLSLDCFQGDWTWRRRGPPDSVMKVMLLSCAGCCPRLRKRYTPEPTGARPRRYCLFIGVASSSVFAGVTFSPQYIFINESV